MAKWELFLKLFFSGLMLALIFGFVERGSSWEDVIFALVMLYVVFDIFWSYRRKYKEI